ncbi:MAG: glycosyltransferase family 4 protein, partial [Nitrospinota bacterium]
MKIALIRASVHRRGGAERYAFHLARGLAERGHEVHLYARRCEELPHPRVIFHRVPTLGGFSVLKVLSFAWSVRRMLAGGHAAPGEEPSLSSPPIPRGHQKSGESRSGPVAGTGGHPGAANSSEAPSPAVLQR